MKQPRMRIYYVLAAVLGVLALILGVIPLQIRAQLGPVPIVVVLLAAVTAFLAGRTAKQAGLGPVKAGAMVGLIYGLLGGIGILLAPHLTEADLKKQLQKAHRALPPAANLHTVVAASNSMLFRGGSLVVLVVIAVVVGLLIALVGGATAKSPGQAGSI